MNATSDTCHTPGRLDGAGLIITVDPAHAAAPSRAELYARAEHTMRRGKRLVIGGFVVAVIGIVGYCVACLSSAVHPVLEASIFEDPEWLVGPTLGIIGLGTLLWLVGSFVYLRGAMDSDPSGPDLHL